MLEVPESEILARMREENPWWLAGGGIHPDLRQLPRRAYLLDFTALVRRTEPHRAVVLMGPRRVGKTYLVYHAIHELMERHAVIGRDILYVNLETPIYNRLSLDDLVVRFRGMFQRPAGQALYVFFDEVQYLKEWEVHLKDLVERHRDVRFTATGSSAVALKTKSHESGAGRFTEYLLPPLTFAEFLRFINKEEELIEVAGSTGRYTTPDILGLNAQFINYMNYGGYPEAVFSLTIQQDPQRYIKNDIVDKVLLRDLPTLYGITDIQELNSLFNTLAYHTSREVSLEELSKTSNVAKNTLVRYLEYLEAAFLIRQMRRVDEDVTHFRRRTTFKVFLTNPTMRAALFNPLKHGDPALGQQVETAIFSQWTHNRAFIDSLHYARWKKGEVDFVSLDPTGRKAQFVVEVKWSDAVFNDPGEIKGVLHFCAKHKLKRMPLVTTLVQSGNRTMHGIEVEFTPASLHAYTVGKNTLERKARY
jgi:predicted AAA+ superfamily ATPase